MRKSSKKQKRTWTFGLFSDARQAQELISEGITRGFNKKVFSVYMPHSIRSRKLGGIRVEARYPEVRWLLWGAFIGGLLGALVGLIGVQFYTTDQHISLLAFAGHTGAGALFGAMYSVLFRDSDTLLHAYYAEKVDPDKILVAICSKVGHADHMRRARKLFMDKGIPVGELPDVQTASHVINEVIPQH